MTVTKTYAARFDSNSANNPALNLTGDPAISITFVNESITGAPGDILLEGDTTTGTADPDTVVLIDGVSYEFSISVIGTLPTTNNNGANQVPAEFRGSDIYIITVYDYPAPGETTRIAFMPQEEATLADMDAFGTGATDISAGSGPPPPSPICFVAGTLIATPAGLQSVERLKVGDLVLTADQGAQPIWWIGESQFNWETDAHPQKPIEIKAGTLGHGLPKRDLCVSPQHRILVTDPEGQDILAPAKALTGFPGIRQMRGKRQVVYVHLLLPRHSVIFAEGAATESLFPGEMALAAMSMDARRNILTTLRDRKMRVEGYGAGARDFATVQQVRQWANLHTPPPSRHCGQADAA